MYQLNSVRNTNLLNDHFRRQRLPPPGISDPQDTPKYDRYSDMRHVYRIYSRGDLSGV